MANKLLLHVSISVLILVSSLSWSAQQPRTMSAHRDSVRVYYDMVHKAEMAIVDSNYKLALDCYKKAEQYKQFNCEDLYNAGIVAYLSKDTTAAIEYLNRLAINGLKKKNFEGNNWGRTIKDSSFYKYISRSYDSCLLVGSRSVKPIYSQQLKSFYAHDQKVRRNGTAGNSASIADAENRSVIAAFIEKEGFPSFERTGFYDTMRFLESPGSFYYIWWHSRPQVTILDTLALNAVLNGEFPPDDYAELIDQRILPGMSGSIYKTNFSTASMSKALYNVEQETSAHQTIDPKTTDSIRNTIYLEPLEEYMKKLIFRDKDNRFLIVNLTSYGLHKFSQKLEMINNKRTNKGRKGK
ncbi:hypothetical protein [Taibaiella helva]|uniref:hypothetical protein n=1 Tax=Taibaiella helva TaxID=2301235 RepID=UPI000E587FD8|nr:hypothetical protein [Taibaiella helva]